MKNDKRTLVLAGSMRALLIEDDELLGDGIAVGLEQSGWVVDWARDGALAQTALETEVFDTVVLDLGLPKRPGIKVLRWLRASGNEVPVLILTATDGIAERVAALDAGADDYVSKPFDLNELCARLRALRRRAASHGLPVIRHGAIAVDPAGHSVTLNDAPLTLSPKEFAILQTLVENAGRVVSRHRLMGSIYGWDDDIGSNVLEVHIHNLRRKLGSAALSTVRCVGYRLD
jgi:two-component system response regulator QseB